MEALCVANGDKTKMKLQGKIRSEVYRDIEIVVKSCKEENDSGAEDDSEL